MFDDSEQQGCGLTPGFFVVLGLAALWMLFVPRLYYWWRGGGAAPSSETEKVKESRPLTREEQARELRALAAEFRERGDAERAERLEAAAKMLEASAAPAAASDDASAAARAGAAAEALRSAEESLPAGETARRLALEAEKTSESPLAEERTTGEPDAGPSVSAQAGAEGETPEAPALTLVAETDDLILTLSTVGASVERAALKGYTLKPEGKTPLDILLPLRGMTAAANSFILRAPEGAEEAAAGIDLSAAAWSLSSDTGEFDFNNERRIEFTTTSRGVEFRKTYTLRRKGLVFGLKVAARNMRRETIQALRLDLVGPNGIAPDGTLPKGMLVEGVLAGRDSAGASLGLKTLDFKSASSDGFTARSLSKRVNEWVASKGCYFAVVMQAEETDPVELMYAEGVVPERYAEAGDEDQRHLLQPNVATVMRLKMSGLTPGSSASARLSVYLGPLSDEAMAPSGAEHGWGGLISFGWFGWLSRFLLVLLNAFYFVTKHLGLIVGGYGLAILVLTLVVKGALYPLQRKAMISMNRMQRLAPEIKAIKKRYDKDKTPEGRRKMQAETMELYGKHGVSPLGGCLPMLVQLPMFIAFYGMLRGAFELRHAPYLWIADLTQPDELINFGGWAIPLVGWGALNLLPVLYAAMFLLGQRLQPVPEDPQAQQQQKMMKYMVVFLFFIFYSMPAALVLYFVFSQAISLLEQWYIRKYVTDLQAAPATAGAGGGVSAVPVKTSWDKQAEKDARTAEKRRQKKKDRENRPGAPR